VQFADRWNNALADAPTGAVKYDKEPMMTRAPPGDPRPAERNRDSTKNIKMELNTPRDKAELKLTGGLGGISEARYAYSPEFAMSILARFSAKLILPSSGCHTEYFVRYRLAGHLC
jgi:hypothetical protein